MRDLLEIIDDIIEAKNRLRPHYQSGYTTGGRDYYECPTCGATLNEEDNYILDNFNHSSDCMYKLVSELEDFYKTMEKEVSRGVREESTDKN